MGSSDTSRRKREGGEREDPRDAEAAWAAHNLSQLRYFRSLSLRAKLEAVEGMADVVRRFQELRRQGRFVSRSRANAEQGRRDRTSDPERAE